MSTKSLSPMFPIDIPFETPTPVSHSSVPHLNLVVLGVIPQSQSDQLTGRAESLISILSRSQEGSFTPGLPHRPSPSASVRVQSPERTRFRSVGDDSVC